MENNITAEKNVLKKNNIKIVKLQYCVNIDKNTTIKRSIVHNNILVLCLQILKNFNVLRHCGMILSLRIWYSQTNIN